MLALILVACAGLPGGSPEEIPEIEAVETSQGYWLNEDTYVFGTPSPDAHLRVEYIYDAEKNAQLTITISGLESYPKLMGLEWMILYGYDDSDILCSGKIEELPDDSCVIPHDRLFVQFYIGSTYFGHYNLPEHTFITVDYIYFAN